MEIKIAESNNNNQHNETKGDNGQVQHTKQEVQLNPPSISTPSPSHEFSFTISLQTPKIPNHNNNNKIKSQSPPPPPPPSAAAVDLSPADEIFFHGHLLPLRLLRPSTDFSSDTFTLPIKNLLPDKENNNNNIDEDDDDDDYRSRNVQEAKARGKSRSFSIFPKRQKHQPFDQNHDRFDDDLKPKRKSKFDVVKRYMRLIKLPFFLTFRNKKRGKNNLEFLSRRPFSYSGNLRVRKNKGLTRGLNSRGEFSSAPVSMIHSPNHSGVLIASGNLTPIGKNDSSMEELQAAIQAAIAHCKKSIGEGNKE